MIQVAILIFVCLATFKLIAEYRIGRNEDIAAKLGEIIKPHVKFREFYTQTFAACQNEHERSTLMALAAAKEREFDLRVSRILGENASRQDLKMWLKFYTHNPEQPFSHSSEKFNQSTTELASSMIEDVMDAAREKLNVED